jgi:hypothetical protein
MDPSSCPLLSGFSDQEYASSVSALAGVVGAVIVAAIALRLGSSPPLESYIREKLKTSKISDEALQTHTASIDLGNFARPLLAMPAALVAALLSAYGYANVAGTTKPCIAAQLTVFAGGQLALAAVLTLFAITWLLRDYGTHGHAILNTLLLTLIVAAVSSYFLGTSLADLAQDRGQTMSSTQWLVYYSVFAVWGAAALGFRALAKPQWKAFVSSVRVTQIFCLLAIAAVVVGALSMAEYSNAAAVFAPWFVNEGYLWMIGIVLRLPYSLCPISFTTSGRQTLLRSIPN